MWNYIQRIPNYETNAQVIMWGLGLQIYFL